MLADYLDYIENLHPLKIDLGLERVQHLAMLLGLTHFACPVVTVAGTNGKGSCVKILESIYRANQYTVAAYTSPHLLRFQERLRMNGDELSEQSWLTAFQVIERYRAQQTLTFFEYITLAALVICQTLQPDVLLLEVGLGGRFDAVNVVEPDVAVISNIARDHTEWLGEGLAAIAYQKAGIFRPYRPAIYGDTHPEVMQVLQQVAKDLSTDLYCLGRDFSFLDMSEQSNHWQWQYANTRHTELPRPHLKMENAASAIMTVTALQHYLPVSPAAIQQGIGLAQLPGRLQVLEEPVLCLLDVAHNPNSAEYLATYCRQHPVSGKNRAVLAMLKDKDIAATARCLEDVIEHWYLAGLDLPRGASLEEMTLALGEVNLKNCYHFDSVEQALTQAIHDFRPGDRVVVLGSFHTVAIAQIFLTKHF